MYNIIDIKNIDYDRCSLDLFTVCVVYKYIYLFERFSDVICAEQVFVCSVWCSMFKFVQLCHDAPPPHSDRNAHLMLLPSAENHLREMFKFVQLRHKALFAPFTEIFYPAFCSSHARNTTCGEENKIKIHLLWRKKIKNHVWWNQFYDSFHLHGPLLPGEIPVNSPVTLEFRYRSFSPSYNPQSAAFQRWSPGRSASGPHGVWRNPGFPSPCTPNYRRGRVRDFPAKCRTSGATAPDTACMKEQISL